MQRSQMTAQDTDIAAPRTLRGMLDQCLHGEAGVVWRGGISHTVCCQGGCGTCELVKTRADLPSTHECAKRPACCPSRIVSSGQYCRGPLDIACVLGTPPPPTGRGVPFFSWFFWFEMLNASLSRTGRTGFDLGPDWERKVFNVRLPRLQATPGLHGPGVLGTGQLPPLVGWKALCKWARPLQSSDHSAGHSAAALGALLPPKQSVPLAQKGVWHERRAAARARLVDKLRADLHARGVLCDAAYPCTLLLERNRVTVCLPNTSTVREAHMCEPWGETWQQQGGPIGKFAHRSAVPGCWSFDLALLSRSAAGTSCPVTRGRPEV